MTNTCMPLELSSRCHPRTSWTNSPLSISRSSRHKFASASHSDSYLFRLACDLIDAAANVKLSAKVKAKVIEKRAEAARKSEEAKERLAEEREKMAEAKRKAEKARLAAMSPEERAKEEERQRKRQLRKQTGKMKIILK